MEASVNGIRVHYEIDGTMNAPWVTLGHSLMYDLTMWDPQVSALTEKFRVLRFDTRGHGETEAPKGPYDLGMLVDDLLGLLKALKIEETHYVGLSMGGMIGQAAALRPNAPFKSLVMADTLSRYDAAGLKMWDERIELVSAHGMEAMVPKAIEKWFTISFREKNPSILPKIEDKIRNTSPAGFIGCCHALRALDTTDRLPEIAVPTLVIVGEDDQSTPPSGAEIIKRGIPGAQLKIIPSAAHLSNVEQAERFTGHMMSFLNSQP